MPNSPYEQRTQCLYLYAMNVHCKEKTTALQYSTYYVTPLSYKLNWTTMYQLAIGPFSRTDNFLGTITTQGRVMSTAALGADQDPGHTMTSTTDTRLHWSSQIGYTGRRRGWYAQTGLSF